MIRDIETKLHLPKKSSLIFRVIVCKWRCGCLQKLSVVGRRSPCHATPYALCECVTCLLVFLGTSVLCHGVRHRR